MVPERSIGVGWGAEEIDDVAAGDRVAATVRVAIGVFATGVGLRVCAVGVDAAALAGTVRVSVTVLVGIVRVGASVLVGVLGVGITLLASAVGVETSISLSPGRSSTGCATARLFNQ